MSHTMAPPVPAGPTNHTLEAEDKPRIRLYFGTTGSGKTYLMHKHLMEESRVILFDTMADEAFENYGVCCDKLEDGVDYIVRTDQAVGRFRVRFQFADLERFDYVCKLLVKKPHGKGLVKNVTLAVDELSTFTKAGWSPEHLQKIVRLGRHSRTRLWATSQRPPDIHKLIRSQAKEVYLFQMHEKEDLDVFRNRLPDVERLVQLQKGQYLLWHPSTANEYDAEIGGENHGHVQQGQENGQGSVSGAIDETAGQGGSGIQQEQS